MNQYVYRRLVFLVQMALCISVWSLTSTHAWGRKVRASHPAKTTQTGYSLHIAPYSWWTSFARNNRPGMVLSLRQWKAFWTQEQNRSVSSMWVSAPIIQHVHATGQATHNTLSIQIRLKIRALHTGWKRIRIPLRGVGLESFQMSPHLKGTLTYACPTHSTCAKHRKDLWLSLKGPTQGTILLKGGVRIQKTLQGQRIDFQLPSAPTSAWLLKLLKRQEVKTSLSHVQSHLTNNATIVMGSVPHDNNLHFRLTAQESGTKQHSMVAVDGIEQLHIQPSFQRRTVSLKIMDRLKKRTLHSIQIPKGYKLLGVYGAHLHNVRWISSKRILYIQFRSQNKTTSQNVQIRLIRKRRGQTLHWSPLQLRGAYSQTGRILIRMHRTLQARTLHSSKVQRIAIPARQNALYQQARFWSPTSSIRLYIRTLRPYPEVTPAVKLYVKERQIQWDLKAHIRAREGRLQNVLFHIEKGWMLRSFQDHAGRNLRYWKRSNGWLIQLPKAVKENHTTHIRLSFARQLKKPTKASTFFFRTPRYSIEHAKFKEGRMYIYSPSKYRIQQVPPQLLKRISKRRIHRQSILGFKVFKHTDTGIFKIQKKKTRIRALVVHRYHLSSKQLEADFETHLQFQGAGTHQFQWSVTHTNGGRLQFSVSSPHRIVSKSSQYNPQTKRTLWTFKLAKEHIGKLTLLAQYQRPLQIQSHSTSIHLPMVRVPQAVNHRGLSAVYAHSHIQFKASNRGLRLLDPLLLPRPIRTQIWKSPALAYRYQGTHKRLTLKLKSLQAKRLVQTLVAFMHVKGALHTHGSIRLHARYKVLSTHGSIFECSLPKKARLLSALLDNRGVKPLQQGQDVRIALPVHHTMKSFFVDVIYTLPSTALPKRKGTVKTWAPTVQYPVQETYWNISIPPTHQVFGSTSSKQRTSTRIQSLWIGLAQVFSYTTHTVHVLLVLLCCAFLFPQKVLAFLGIILRILFFILSFVYRSILYLKGKWYRWAVAACICFGIVVFAVIMSLQLTRSSAPYKSVRSSESSILQDAPPRFAKIITLKEKRKKEKDRSRSFPKKGVQFRSNQKLRSSTRRRQGSRTYKASKDLAGKKFNLPIQEFQKKPPSAPLEQKVERPEKTHARSSQTRAKNMPSHTFVRGTKTALAQAPKSKPRDLDNDQVLKKHGTLGMLKKHQKQLSKILAYPSSNKASHTSKARFKKMKWMMRSGETQMMRGIRSLKLSIQPTGIQVNQRYYGAQAALQTTLWNRTWLNQLLFILFGGTWLFFLCLGLSFPKYTHILFWMGLVLTTLGGLLSNPGWLLFSNAITLGILAAGLCFLARRAARQVRLSSAGLILCIFLGSSGFLAHEAHAQNPVSTQKRHTTSHCLHIWSNIQRPTHAPRLYVPTQDPLSSSFRLTPSTPVFIPAKWWLWMQKQKYPECQKERAYRVVNLQSHYVVTRILSDRIVGFATFRMQTFTPGWHTFALGLRGARMVSHTFQSPGKSKVDRHFVRYGKQGYEAHLQGVGVQYLKLAFTARKKVHQKSFTLHTSSSAATGLTVHLPQGKWDVQVPQAQGGFQLLTTEKKPVLRAALGPASLVHVRWSPRNSDTSNKRENAEVIRFVHVDLLEHLTRIKERFDFIYRYSRHNRFVFALPQHVRLEKIAGESIRKWYIRREASGKRQLIVHLQRSVRRAQIDVQTIVLRTSKHTLSHLPFIQPMGVSSLSGVLGFRIQPNLQVALRGVDTMARRTPKAYKQATQNWGGNVQEAYAFQRMYPIQMTLKKKTFKPKIHAQIHVHYPAPDTKQPTQIHAYFRYTQLKQNVFKISFRVPSSLQIRRIRCAQKGGIHQYWFRPSAQKGEQIVHIELKKPLRSGEWVALEARLRTSESTTIPSIFPREFKHVQGLLSLSVPMDQSLRTTRLYGLQPRTALTYRETLRYNPSSVRKMHPKGRAFFAFTQMYKGHVILQKKVSTAHSKGYIVVRVEEAALHIQGRLTFRATNAGKRSWSIQLPTAWMGQLEWLQQPKQSTLRTSSSNGLNTVHWKLLRPSTLQHIRFRTRLSLSKSGVRSIGRIFAKKTLENNWTLLLQKGSQLRVHTSTKSMRDLEKLSLSELSGVHPNERRDLVAAYRILQPNWSLQVRKESLRSQLAIRPTIEMAHIKMFVGPQGNASVQTTYTLRTPGLRTLTVTLPPKATLWQVLVEGRSIRPARKGRDYTIPLPPKQTSDLAYTVQLLYVEPYEPLSTGMKFTPHIPKASIDVVETFWTLVTPYTYSMFWPNNIENASQIQLDAQRLHNALRFRNKLKKMAAIGSPQQQWRALSNLAIQKKSIRRSISRVRSRLYRYQRKTVQDKTTFQNLQSTLRQWKNKAVQTRGRSTSPSIHRLDPTRHWKELFGLKTTQHLHTTSHAHAQNVFKWSGHGRSRIYKLRSTLQPSVRIYSSETIARTTGWFVWLCLALGGFGWFVRIRKKASTQTNP